MKQPNHKPALAQTQNKPPVPTESVEQQNLFCWAAYRSGVYPELELMYHVPNEGGARRRNTRRNRRRRLLAPGCKRSRATGGRMRAEGLKSGVPDICIPVPRGGYHGLYIELKRVAGGKATPAQTQWLAALAKQGYRTALCEGWESAATVIENYLKEGM